MFKLKLHWQILIALFIAVLYGLLLTDYVSYVSWIGDLFLRALKMIIVPLILTSIISCVANIGDAHNLGRLGLKTFAYYITTSFFAILTGLILVNIIQPGVGADLGLRSEVPELAATSGDLGDIIMRTVPTNVFDALVSADMLAIIFFSILIGFFITRVSAKYKVMFADFFNGSFEVMMR
jgi:Na+/H+-dicarboxylate symporter